MDVDGSVSENFTVDQIAADSAVKLKFGQTTVWLEPHEAEHLRDALSDVLGYGDEE